MVSGQSALAAETIPIGHVGSVQVAASTWPAHGMTISSAR